jgi:hypothetical protein
MKAKLMASVQREIDMSFHRQQKSRKGIIVVNVVPDSPMSITQSKTNERMKESDANKNESNYSSISSI